MAITKFEQIQSLFVGQGDIVLFGDPETGVYFADGKDYSNATIADFINPKSLGQIVEDSTSWTGDDVSFEDIRDEVVAKYQYVDVAALERVFNKEREAIIQADTSYRWLRDLLDEGKTEEEICKAMLIKHTAYVRMVKALPVLDIPRENTAQEEETAGDPGLTLEVGKEESMEDLATKFNESVESHRMTELEKQEIDNFEKERSIRKGTKKGGKTRKKDDKTPKKPKVVAVEAIDTGDTVSGVVVNEFVPPTDADDFHLDVESDLIDSASSDSVIKHATEGDAENA
jgi:hypothetical protein